MAIIDHADHTLFVEDVNEEELETEYGGDEQSYIDDNYTFDGGYSWDWITDAVYVKEEEGDLLNIEIDFDEIAQ